MYRLCRHIMPDGARCQAAALNDMPYCYYHDRLHRIENKHKTGKKKSFQLRPLEDRNSVVMALSDVLCALAAGSIDGNTAARLIYGLQVAGQYASLCAQSAPSDAVKSLTVTGTGDELAPERVHCYKSDDCESCPFHDQCITYAAKQNQPDANQTGAAEDESGDSAADEPSEDESAGNDSDPNGDSDDHDESAA